MQHKKTVNNG